jgi:hypothetical protein
MIPWVVRKVSSCWWFVSWQVKGTDGDGGETKDLSDEWSLPFHASEAVVFDNPNHQISALTRQAHPTDTGRGLSYPEVCGGTVNSAEPIRLSDSQSIRLGLSSFQALDSVRTCS